MKILLASDHAGYELKSKIEEYLKSKGVEVQDLGPDNGDESISYVLQGRKLGKEVKAQNEIGIAVCGTGIGISIALNRMNGIRAAKVANKEEARFTKLHNDANVLVFGGRTQTWDEVKDMIDAFLGEEFEGGRHLVRIQTLDE